jgi:hypothetical protein
VPHFSFEFPIAYELARQADEQGVSILVDLIGMAGSHLRKNPGD